MKAMPVVAFYMNAGLLVFPWTMFDLHLHFLYFLLYLLFVVVF